ncbi:MAG: LytR/AlgR family response regulator transcription factor [Steroidobacteraceae bacterium]
MHAASPRPLPHREPGPKLQFFWLVNVAATALALLTTAQEGAALAYAGQSIPWTGLLKARLIDWYACALFMPALFWLARRFPLDRKRWQHHLPVLLLAGVPIAIAKEALFVAIGNLLRPGVFDFATILSEDLSYEVMAVWAFLAVAQLLIYVWREAAPETCEEILVRTRRGFERVRLEEIELVDAHGNYARLATLRGSYLVRGTMAQLAERLGSDFLRVHRSVIVRRDGVVRVEPAPNGGSWLQLASGGRVRSGRSYRRAVQGLGLSPP